MKTNLLSVVAISAVAALLLTGCPQTGVVCAPGTDRCGDGCADFNTDRRNCGGCGIACQSGQVCSAGKCECDAPLEACGGKCVSTNTDPLNCGGCGQACTTGQLCEATAADGGVGGRCKSGCESATASVCGLSCVELQTDSANCGSCGTVCENGRRCKAGVCTYDIVLACRNYGAIVGVRSTDAGVFKGPQTALGTTPNALAAYADVLLATDDTDRRLLQAPLATFEEFADGGKRLPIGAVPNQVYVNGQLAYVANAETGTLQIVQLDPVGSPAAAHPNGLNLSTVGEVNFGVNTYPQGAVVMAQHAYVPLYGGFGASADAGQRLAKVNVSAPADAGVVELIELAAYAPSFDGGSTLPRPYAVTSFGGKVYVALNNLDPSYQPAGPGVLFELDPAATTGGRKSINLGADKCLNAGSFAQSADTLFVGCIGKSTYDNNFVLTAVEKTGVVALKKNGAGELAVVGSWAPVCTGSCKPPSIGRIAVSGKRVFVADQSEGRVWVLEYSAAGALTELTGLSTALATACPPPSGSVLFSNVADIISVP